MVAKSLPEWYALACKVPGPSAQLWAIVDHMAGINAETRRKRTGAYIVPGSRVSITCDGFAMVDFVDGEGTAHMGALFSSWADISRNVSDFAVHMVRHVPGFTADHAAEMRRALVAMVGLDYRPATMRGEITAAPTVH